MQWYDITFDSLRGKSFTCFSWQGEWFLFVEQFCQTFFAMYNLRRCVEDFEQALLEEKQRSMSKKRSFEMKDTQKKPFPYFEYDIENFLKEIDSQFLMVHSGSDNVMSKQFVSFCANIFIFNGDESNFASQLASGNNPFDEQKREEDILSFFKRKKTFRIVRLDAFHSLLVRHFMQLTEKRIQKNMDNEDFCNHLETDMFSQKPWWSFLFKNSHIIDEMEQYIKNKPKPIVDREENTNMLLGYLSNLKSKNPLVFTKDADKSKNAIETKKKIIIDEVDVEELVEQSVKNAQARREEKKKSVQNFFKSPKKIEKIAKIVRIVEKSPLIIVEKEKNIDNIDKNGPLQTEKQFKSQKDVKLQKEVKTTISTVNNIKPTTSTNGNSRLRESLLKIKNKDDDLNNDVDRILVELERTKEKIDSFMFTEDSIVNSPEIFSEQNEKSISNLNSLDKELKHTLPITENKDDEQYPKKDFDFTVSKYFKLNNKNVNHNNNSEFREKRMPEGEKETRLTLVDPHTSVSNKQPTHNFQQNNNIQITHVYNIINREEDLSEDNNNSSDEDEYQLSNLEKRIEKDETYSSLTKFSLPLVDIATKKVKRRRTLTSADKKDVAASQEWKCASCKNLLPAEYEVHHVIEFASGGSDNYENLRALCANCHRKEGGNSRKKKKPEVWDGYLIKSL